jgi:iron(III) transport system substrate-binding protein
MIANGPADERAAAETLFDWALGETAAELYASKFVVPFVDVPLADGAVPISEVNTIVQDDVWAAANKERLVNRWNELIGNDAITE